MPKKTKKKQIYEPYLKKVDHKDPYHIIAIILVVFILGIIVMWVVKALIYVVLIGGGIYVIYLLILRLRARDKGGMKDGSKGK